MIDSPFPPADMRSPVLEQGKPVTLKINQMLMIMVLPKPKLLMLIQTVLHFCTNWRLASLCCVSPLTIYVFIYSNGDYPSCHVSTCRIDSAKCRQPEQLQPGNDAPSAKGF